MIVSPTFILRIINISDKLCRVNQNSQFMFNNFFPKIVPFMRKCGITGQATDDSIILRMCIAGRIIKATDTHSEYVILIGFPRQQCLANAPHFSVYTYIVSHVIYCVIPTLVHAFNFVCTTSPTLLLTPDASMQLPQN